MPFDVPKDPNWGKEYFGGIFLVFNEAVLKGSILEDIREIPEIASENVIF